MNEGLRGYALLFRWEFLRQRQQLPVIIVIQVVLAVGVVYGMSFLLPNIDPQSALYLATGAPTLSLLIMGLVAVAQEVGRSKDTGREEYLRALPLPALAVLGATVTFWLLANLPGTALSLWVAKLRFGVQLDVTPLVIPVILLVALTASSVGYAMAQALTPQVTQQLSSFLSIGILLFSPINFPIDRLPVALQQIHLVLPITYMADLIRWSLTGNSTHSPGVGFAVLGAWCAAGLALSYRVATRRR
ncbi:MAG TPA: ABC transporter permease [Actinomycetota bacterium]|nr:ABC transporter permease [Actinomycetota bacterium]